MCFDRQRTKTDVAFECQNVWNSKKVIRVKIDRSIYERTLGLSRSVRLATCKSLQR